MQIEAVDIERDITKVILAGRMDIEGTSKIDLPFSTIAGSKSKLAVDMSEVSFLASLGMRTLVTAAKTVARKGGKLVLVSPQPNVAKVLKSSGIDTVIPIVDEMSSALQMLKA